MFPSFHLLFRHTTKPPPTLSQGSSSSVWSAISDRLARQTIKKIFSKKFLLILTPFFQLLRRLCDLNTWNKTKIYKVITWRRPKTEKVNATAWRLRTCKWVGIVCCDFLRFWPPHDYHEFIRIIWTVMCRMIKSRHDHDRNKVASSTWKVHENIYFSPILRRLFLSQFRSYSNIGKFTIGRVKSKVHRWFQCQIRFSRKNRGDVKDSPGMAVRLRQAFDDCL